MRRKIIAKHYYNILYLVHERTTDIPFVDCRVVRDGRCLGYIIATNREEAIEKFNNREWLHY